MTWVHQVNSGIECGRGGGGGCGENARSGREYAGGGGENAAGGGGGYAGEGSGGVGGGGGAGLRGGGDTEVAEDHKLAAEVEDAEKFVEPVGRAEAHPTKSSSMIPKIGVITQDQWNYENS